MVECSLNKSAEHGISVLMPVHNAGDFLQAAVSSILNQHGVTLELILIDDHSSDGAIESLKPDPRLRVISSPACGIAPALNHGIANAKLPFIARMDGDDIALPDRLAKQLKLLVDNPDIHICGTLVEMFSDTVEIAYGYRRYQDWINQQVTPEQIEKNFFVESCIPHPSAMLHRDVLSALGGYHDTPWPEDYDLWCRAFIAGYRFAKPPAKILLRWRDYGERSSRVQERYNKQQFLQCKAKYLAQYLSQRGINSCVIWGTGPTGTKQHNYLENNGIAVTAFIDINPKLVGRKKHDKPIHVVGLEPSKDELKVITDIAIIAVSAWGAREKIRAALLNANFVELEDYIVAA